MRQRSKIVRMERMEAHIKQKLLSLGITRGERLGVAVSGGADSMALLHCLCNLRHELNIIVMVYHMEHGIRGQRSVQDMQFVQRMCEKYGVSCITERADVPGIARKQGISLETAGARRGICFWTRRMRHISLQRTIWTTMRRQ